MRTLEREQLKSNLTSTQIELLEKIKNQISLNFPTVKIFLYGSRVRGDASEDSDWDFLILTDDELSEKRKLEIRHMLFEIEWETNEVISSIIHSQREWNEPIMQITPFYQNVVREGIVI